MAGSHLVQASGLPPGRLTGRHSKRDFSVPPFAQSLLVIVLAALIRIFDTRQEASQGIDSLLRQIICLQNRQWPGGRSSASAVRAEGALGLSKSVPRALGFAKQTAVL